MDILKEVRTSKMSRLQIRPVTVAIALMLIDGMDVAVAAYAAPALSKAWSLNPVTLGFLLSAGLVGMAAVSLFLTPFSDKIGRRKMMLVALVLVSTGMVLSVFAGDVVQLMAFRLLAGLGIGGMIANLNVYTSEYSSDKRRGSIFGLYTAGFAIGATLGGFIAGPLIPQFGWRPVFAVGAAASILMLAVTWRFLPESLDYLLSKRPSDALRKVNAILVQMRRPMLTVLPELPQDQQPQRGIKDLLTGRMAAETILLWTRYGLMIAAYYFASTAAYYFASTWTPKLIATSSGDDSLGVTMGLGVNFGGIIGCFIFSILAVFLRSRHLLLGSLLISALIYVVFGMNFTQISVAIIVGALLGVVTSANVAGFYATTPGLFPAAFRGTGIGWMVGIGRLVSIVSPIVVGYLLAASWKAENIFMLFGVPLIVSALAMAAVWSLSRKTTVPASSRSSPGFLNSAPVPAALPGRREANPVPRRSGCTAQVSTQHVLTLSPQVDVGRARKGEATMKETPESLPEMFFLSFVREQLNGLGHNEVPFPQGDITSSAWAGWWHEENLNEAPLTLLHHGSGGYD